MEALLYSFLAGASTVIGALVIALFGQPQIKILAGLLGFAGGIMLAISLFELMPESAEIGSFPTTILGLFLGALMMYLLDKIVPHAHMSGGQELNMENATSMTMPSPGVARTGYLVFFGIALHNLPEGLAVGAGFETSPELGIAVAFAIALHNIPEGMAVAGPLRAGGLKWKNIYLLTLIAGLMSPVGVAIGLLIFGISPILVSGGLGFAAGAMVYIVNDELIPQSHRLDTHIANAGLLVGLALGFAIFY